MYIIGKKCGEKMKDYSEYFKGPNLKEAQKRSRKQVDHLKDAFEIPSDMVSVGKGKTYYIHTYGCQANERDGETLAGIFEMMGYTAAKEIEEADVILLNTCAIRENAEEKVFGKVGYVKNLKKKKPNLIFGLCGCMAQEEVVIKRILEKHPHIDLIFGTHNIHRLPTLLKEAMFSKEMVVEVWSKEGDVIENTPVTRANGHKAWVNIMYGCNNFCSYCIVPYVRGRERSRVAKDIVREIEALVKDGVVEVMLLGQNVNSYGKNLEQPMTFAELLKEIEQIDGLERIRFMTSHPKDLSDDLIEVMANSKKICPHLHLPLQSGSSRILKAMNRRYDKEKYLALAKKIRERMPDIALTTDIIVGFPGETEEDFQETLDVVRQVRYDSAFTFIYSKRTGTPAAMMEDQIPEDVVKDRFDRLLKEVQTISKEMAERFTGNEETVLVEEKNSQMDGYVTGRLGNNHVVHFEGSEELIGKLIRVRLDECRGFYYMGTMLDK